MAFTRALYYPTIDITNETWLKTAGSVSKSVSG